MNSNVSANERQPEMSKDISLEQKIGQIEQRLKIQQDFSVNLIQILDQQTQALNSLQPIIKIDNFNPMPIIQSMKEDFIKWNIDLSKEQFDKLYEKIYCSTATLEPLVIFNQIEDKVEAKLEICREIKTKLMGMTTKLDQQTAKSVLLEQSMNKLNTDLDQKPSKQEIKQINEQIKISLTNFSNSLRLLADKDTVKYLVDKMQNLDRIMEEIVSKKYYEEQSQIRQKYFKDELLNEIKNEFETQAQSRDNIFTLEKTIKKQTLEFEKYKEQNTLKIVGIDQLINDSRLKISQKVEKTEFQEFKQWSNSYVHLSNVNHIYENIVPIVKNCKKETEQCFGKLKIFEVFLNNIDETLLFKCEKMELRKLQTLIEDTFLQKNEFEKVEKQLKQQTNNSLSSFQKKYEDNVKVMFSSTKSQLFPLIKDEIREQIQKYDTIQQKVADLIDNVQLELKKKADYSHIIQLQNEKTSKTNTEQMFKDLKRINQHLMSMSHYILNFMKQFLPSVENQSIQTRKKEIQSMIENVQGLFEKIHNASIIPGQANIIYHNQSQNNRSMSPYERVNLAKEIIKQNINGGDEDYSHNGRKNSKPQTNNQGTQQSYNENEQTKYENSSYSNNFMTLSTMGGRSKATSVTFNSRPTTPQPNYKKTPSKGRPLRPLIQISQQAQNIFVQTISADHIAKQEIKREMHEEQSQQLQTYYLKSHNANSIRSKRETTQSQANQTTSTINISEYQRSTMLNNTQDFEQYPIRNRNKTQSNNIDSQQSIKKVNQNQFNAISSQLRSDDEINLTDDDNDDEQHFRNQRFITDLRITDDSSKQIQTSQ